MNYKDHRITDKGYIHLWELTGEGKPHKRMIMPNEPIPDKYLSEIEADENFEKYRTQENADAYEAKFKELEPTAEELAEQEEKRKEKAKREEALERLIAKEIKEMEKE